MPDNSRVSRLLSRPSTYIAWYFCLIPIFATIYSHLPEGFYAPYAKLERESRSDAYATGRIFQEALFRMLISDQTASAFEMPDLTFLSDMSNISQFSGTDTGGFRFRLLLGFRTKAGLAQFSADVLVGSETMYSEEPGKAPVISRFLTLDDKGPLDQFLANFLITKAQIEKKIQKVDFSLDEYKKLERYSVGVAGDPTSISGGWWRMLYFSAIVITTVGFGDIVPMTNIARLCCALEAVLGIILAGLFLNAVAGRRDRETV